MRLGLVAAATPLAAIALAGCGGSSTSSSGTSSSARAAKAATPTSSVRSPTLPAGTPAALRGPHGAALRAGDLPGFVPQSYEPPSTSAKSWVAEYPPALRAAEAAKLEALGFVAGNVERLAPPPGSGSQEAISLVEEYRSAHGASGEVAAQVEQARSRAESAFPVAGIPGAGGWGSDSSVKVANVAFAAGAYYYLVGFSWTGAGGPTHAQLVTAAQRLYRRVRG
jgi:hypothetical protein